MSLKKYLKILELSDTASIEDIEKAHTELIGVWSPDRFPDGSDLREQALQKTIELNYAYEEIKKHYNKFKPIENSTGLNERLRKQIFWFASVVLVLVVICFAFYSAKQAGVFERPETDAIDQQNYFSLKESINKSMLVKEKKAEVSGMVRLEDVVSTVKPPFFQAAVECNTVDVRGLLDRGQSINEQDFEGNTALVWASRQGCEETVKFLISRGANVNQKSKNGFSPLMWANLYNREKIQKDLLAAGSEPLPKFWDKK